MKLTEAKLKKLITPYSVYKKRQPFDWYQVLKRVSVEGVSKKEHTKLKNRAQSWTTCACGNSCAIIPRMRYDQTPFSYQTGMPLDQYLADLGVQFFQNIVEKDWVLATDTLNHIENRSLILVKEEYKKLGINYKDSDHFKETIKNTIHVPELIEQEI